MEAMEAPTSINSENIKLIINNSKIKIIANKQNIGNEELMFEKYETEIELTELKNKNKYFRMFETYQEFKFNSIELCKENKVNIIKEDNNEINISENLMVINDNLIYLTLKKIELNQKAQIDFLIEDSKLKVKKIEDLNIKIISMEKTIQNLISRIESLEKLNNKNININNSKIFANSEEIWFIFSAIFNYNLD